MDPFAWLLRWFGNGHQNDTDATPPGNEDEPLRSLLADDVSEPWSGFDDGIETDQTDINPATGLPMVGGVGGLDAGGNPWGVSEDMPDSCSVMNDDWPGGCDDLFGSGWDGVCGGLDDHCSGWDPFDSLFDDDG